MFRAWSTVIALLAGVLGSAAAVAAAGPLATAPVRTGDAAVLNAFDGVVDAVRQTVVAAQVAGAVIALEVKVGDAVKSGQVLARIDARTADYNASASDAQVRSAQALLEMANKDFQRQRQLFDKQYISQAALERAESQYKATQAQAAAQLAQANAARTQSGLHVVRAPYAGVVAEVPVQQGDMAMPGRALLTLYQPGALRVTAAVPQRALVQPVRQARLEMPALPEAQRWTDVEDVQVLPTVDASTHTLQLRIPLPQSVTGAAPGMFARVWLPAAASDAVRPLFVPASAVLRRAEMNVLYVVDDKGVPTLRLVRLGRVQGDSVEVLTGVSAGERVARDPQAAARLP